MRFSKKLEDLIAEQTPDPTLLTPDQLRQLIIYRHDRVSTSFLGGDHNKDDLNRLATEEMERISPVSLEWSYQRVDKELVVYTSNLISPHMYDDPDIADSLEGLNMAWVLLQGSDYFHQLDEPTIITGDALHLVCCLQSEFVYT